MTKTKSAYGYIRERDCFYAEKVLGYVWQPLGKVKKDFEHRDFTHVLTPPRSKLDGGSVLEPDTRVPNLTGSLADSFILARALGITTIPVPKAWGYDGLREITETIMKVAEERYGLPALPVPPAGMFQVSSRTQKEETFDFEEEDAEVDPFS